MKTGIYKHFKGNLYEVTGIAKHSETEDELVIYKSVSDERLWARPKAMFEETVEKDGKKVPRFQYIGKK